MPTPRYESAFEETHPLHIPSPGKRMSFAAASASASAPPTPESTWQTGTMETDKPDETGGSPLQSHVSIAIAVALLPPLLSTIMPQKSEMWGDLFAMFLVAYYLHFIISVPYELYHKSRLRSPHSQVLEAVLEAKSTLNSPQSDSPPSSEASEAAAIKAAQAQAEVELNRLQVLYLLFYLASPVVAGIALKVAKDNLFSSSGPIAKQLNTGVFMFVAALRPLGELVQIMRERTLYLRKETAAPVTEVDTLLRRIAELERSLETIHKETATREELQLVKEQLVEPSLDKIARTVRKVEKRESSKSELDEQRFRELERRLMESEEEVKVLQARVEARGEADNAESMARASMFGFVFGYVTSVMEVLLWPWKVVSGVLALMSGAMHQKWVTAGPAPKKIAAAAAHLEE